jgi:hypothetical protein
LNRTRNGNITSIGESSSETILEEQYLFLYTNNAPEVYSTLLASSDNKYPLIVLTELKLQDKVVKGNLAGAERKIKEVTGSWKGKGTYFKFHVFKSLGSSDYVIVFRTRSYSEVERCVLELRNKTIDIRKITCPIFEFTYSIAGVDWRCLDCLDDIEPESYALIRSSIRPPFSFQNMADRINKNPENGDGSWYSTFGRYDLAYYISQKPLKTIVDLLYKKGEDGYSKLLHPANTQLGINNTSTSWLFKMDNLDITEREDLPDYRQIQSSNFHNDASELENCCNYLYGKVPKGIWIALYQIIRIYSLIRQGAFHDTYLYYELHKIIITLLDLTLASMGLKGKKLEAIKAGEPDIPFEVILSEDNLVSLLNGIQYVTETIQNRIQASQLVFEVPTYNFNFIGSAAKLSIMYTAIVELFEDAVRKLNKIPSRECKANKRCEFEFFTVTHYSNVIDSIMLFPYINNVKRKLVPIVLDSASFFEMNHSIAYLIHELGHYIFPNDYEKRNKIFARSIYNWYARNIVFNMIYKRQATLMEILKGNSKEIIAEIQKIVYQKIEKDVNDYIIENKGENFFCVEFQTFVEFLTKSLFDTYSFININVEDSIAILKYHLARLTDSKIRESVEELIQSTVIEKIENGEEISFEKIWWKDIFLVDPDDPDKLVLKTISKKLQILISAATERRIGLEDQWREVIIHCGVFQIIDNILQEHHNLEPFTYNSTYILVRALTEYRLNEYSDTNCIYLVNEINKFCNRNKDDIKKNIEKYRTYFDELLADSFLCGILGLDFSDYLEIVKDNASKQRVPIIAHEDELLLRISVIGRIRGIESANYFDSIIEGLSIDDLKEHQNARKRIDADGDIYGIWIDYLMKDYISFCNELKREKGISDLMEYFKDLRKTPSDLSTEIRFLERYWHEGVKLPLI